MAMLKTTINSKKTSRGDIISWPSVLKGPAAPKRKRGKSMLFKYNKNVDTRGKFLAAIRAV